MKATAKAGANIAFVKYWGQRDPELNLPLNNSISMTMDSAFTVTTIEFSPEFGVDSLDLNGQASSPETLQRVVTHLDRLRALAAEPAMAHVASQNSFPTGAGIASSASGFAALTLAASAALGLSLSQPELSRIARLASGSACRSIFGGFVEWVAGERHEDSYAIPLAPPEHWPLVDVVAIVSEAAKSIPSERGHSLAASSELLSCRLAAVPEMLSACRTAIQTRDFSRLGAVCEADALSLHAVAVTSQPSVRYWTGGTLAVMDHVERWRSEGLPVYFTIDAGPNVHILTLPVHLDHVLERLREVPGVQGTLVCRPGPGVLLMSEHLF